MRWHVTVVAEPDSSLEPMQPTHCNNSHRGNGCTRGLGLTQSVP